jgi:hypothetical protein
VPLNAPFRTDPGITSTYDFSVKTSEAYSLDLGFRDIPPVPEFTGVSTSAIPCDLTLKVSHDGKPIQSEHLDELRQSYYANGICYWRLAILQLPSSGKYRLEIENKSDLTWLAHAAPAVKMDIGPRFYVSSIYNRLLGFIIGIPIALLGLLFFILGIRSPKPIVPPQGVETAHLP